MNLGMTRRTIVQAMLATGGALLAGPAFANLLETGSNLQKLAQEMGVKVSADNLERGLEILRRVAAVDLHAHPARFMIDTSPNGRKPLAPELAKKGDMGVAISDMQAGGLGIAFFSVVADMAVLGLKPNGAPGAIREFAEGEAWTDYERQVADFKAGVRGRPVRMLLKPSDVADARTHGQVAAMLTVEGGDFLEQDISRVQKSFDHGVRSIQLVHYRVNDLGDIQTDQPRHNGLSDFGRAVVREMNRLGQIVDVAHATYETAKATCEVSTKPVILSHSHLGSPEGGLTDRLITNDHAKMIADTGGIIGCWPSGVVQKTFSDFAEEVINLAEVVGVDHVSIGTDMDGNYKPVFDNYRQLPLLPAYLLESGMAVADVEKIMGGNFTRVFEAVSAV